jgi:uncharacterized protein (TIGR01244 family)
MTKWKLFLAAFLLTTVGMTVWNYVEHRDALARRSQLKQIVPGVFITSQLKPNGVPLLRRRGIRSVIDIRPDGEEPNQPSSSEIESASKAAQIGFYYIPVPHENTPDTAVDALCSALSKTEMPTVLYCRTGRRAVRLFALAEASRINGLDVDAILHMVTKAGFSADDLQDAIATRISKRKH